MKKMRQLLSVLLVVAMLTGMLSVSAAEVYDAADENFADATVERSESSAQTMDVYDVEPDTEVVIAEGTCGENVTWALTDDGTLIISGEGAMEDYIRYGAPWNSYRSDITTAVIGDGVTTIGEYAFSGCTDLESITIADSLTIIGSYAFFSCYDLAGVTIPNSVTFISEYAFAYCNGLTSITIPNGVTTIDDCAFLNCDALTSVTIGDSVTEIGQQAFSYCDALTSVTIPVSVTTIDYGAFLDSSALETVYYGGSEKQWNKIEIGKKNDPLLNANIVFAKVDEPEIIAEGTCGENLTWVLTEDGTLTISGTGEMANYTQNNIPWYDYCGQITTVRIGEGVTTIGESAFYGCTALVSATIPEGVTKIGYQAFNGCSALTSIAIPGSVTTIDTSAFSNCSILADITFAEGLTTIGRYAFTNCNALTGISFPDSLTTIEVGAFSNCRGLTSITIPVGVTVINTSVFSGCKALESVTIHDGVTTIGGSAFYNCPSLVSIVIPDSVTSIGNGAFGNCSALQAIIVGENNPNYRSDNGVLFTKDMTQLIAYPVGKSETSYTVPEGVTVIGGGAFSGCVLTSVTLPEGVTTIGDNAFRTSALESINLPDSVTTIGNSAFSYSNLMSITIPKSVTTIGTRAFDGCEYLASAAIYAELTSLPYALFNSCKSLTRVYFLDSVTEIADMAFYGCNALATVYFGGTEEQWNAITVASNNNPLMNARIVFEWSGEELSPEDAAMLAQAEAMGLLQYLEVSDLNAALTRLDGAKLLAAMMDLEPIAGAGNPFEDCEGLTQEEKELIAAVVETGVIKGTGPTTFDPNGELTGAALVTMIYRALGEPETERSEDFADFPVWYMQSVIALQDLGIITEEDINTTLNANIRVGGALKWMIKAKVVLKELEDAELLAQAQAAGLLKYLDISDMSASLTRLDAAKLMAAMLDLEPVPGATVSFADCAGLTQEEKELLAVVVETGIIKGVAADLFDPYGFLTRAQLATMIYRALGEPETERSEGFADFPVWYMQAMIALQDLGIITEGLYPNEIIWVGGALEWMIKAKAILEENNGGDVLLGDVNDDGIVNGTDTNLIFRHVSGTLSFDDAQLAAADVNCDGLVNGTDTNLVFRFVSGTLVSFE